MVARGGCEGEGYCLVFILTTGCIIWLIVQIPEEREKSIMHKREEETTSSLEARLETI